MPQDGQLSHREARRTPGTLLRRTRDSCGLLALAAVLGLACYGAARIGLMIVSEREAMAAFSPAAGLAAGAAALGAGRLRLAVAIGAALGAFIITADVHDHRLAAAAAAVIGASECLVFAWVFERLDRDRFVLESLRSLGAFLIAAVVATALAAVAKATTWSLAGLSSASLIELWLASANADLAGILAVSPVIIVLRRAIARPFDLATTAEGLAAIIIAGSAAGYAYGLIQLDDTGPAIRPATVLFPLSIWLAGRLPLLHSAIAILAVSIVIAISAVAGTGQLGDGRLSQAGRLWVAQMSIDTAAIYLLTLAAMFVRLRNTAEDLVRKDESLRLAFGAAGMYAFDFDLANGRVRRVGSLIETLGLPPAGTIDEYLYKLHHADRSQFQSMLISLSSAQPHMTRQLRLRTIHGDHLVIEHRAEGKFDRRGRLTRIVGTCFDVTRRRSYEQALKDSEERLRLALEAGRVFAFDWDLTTDTMTRSENAAEILGVPPDEAQMKRGWFVALIHPEDRAFFTSTTRRVTAEKPYANFTARLIRPDGRIIWLEFNESGQFDEAGNLVRVSGLTQDVTERMRWEARQANLIEELNHRVKNTLDRISVLIRMTGSEESTVEGLTRVLEGRVRSLASAHQRLSDNLWSGVGLAVLVEDELKPYRAHGNISMEGPDFLLSPDAAQAMSLTLHELATNAAKYGGLSDKGGKVEVRWTVDRCGSGDRRVRLAWREQAPRPLLQPTRKSYGTRTIQNLLKHECGAVVDLRFEPQGLSCDINVPLTRIAAAGGGTASSSSPTPALAQALTQAPAQTEPN